MLVYSVEGYQRLKGRDPADDNLKVETVSTPSGGTCKGVKVPWQQGSHLCPLLLQLFKIGIDNKQHTYLLTLLTTGTSEIFTMTKSNTTKTDNTKLTLLDY